MSIGPGEIEPSQLQGGEAPVATLAPAARVTFSRRELDRIFGLYGRKVAAGEWRDYAIDFLKDRAVFSVFKSACGHDLSHQSARGEDRRQNAYNRDLSHRPDAPRPRARPVLRAIDRSLSVVAGCSARFRQERTSTLLRRVAAPGPSAHCISTPSSQRRNLGRRPNLTCRNRGQGATRSMGGDESPITAIICRKRRARACAKAFEQPGPRRR
jgi:hypothetical protein